MANSYNHNQGSPSSVWTITHNLNTQALTIDVYIDNAGVLTKVLPLSVVHQDNNTVVVTFSGAQFGKARIAI